jgi:putative ABC transport system substrate-binding protein
MRRREVIAYVGAGIAMFPGSIRSQSERLRQVVAIFATAEDDPEGQSRLQVFREKLNELGWVEGRNVQIVARWIAGETGRIQPIAAETVAARPDAILANSAPISAALQRKTSTVPLVFVQIVDPIGQGLVEGLSRPGRNATGFTSYEPSFAGKWLGTLKEAAPQLTRVGLVDNPDAASQGAGSGVYLTSFEAFAASLAISPSKLPARNAADVARAVEQFAREPNGGLLIPPDIFNTTHRHAIIAAADRHRLPAIYPYPFYVRDGGLLSYGIDLLDLYTRAASYVDRILRGEKPAEMPVQQPIKFQLVINLKTARAMGLEIPPLVLARADEVIE